MMTLKALAHEALARIAAQDVSPETFDETRLQRMKQGGEPCFIDTPACFTPVKHANPQKTAENGACFTVSLPRGETHETSLPSAVSKGLATLATGKPSVFGTADAWREIVTDARRIAAEGWAAQALALGWTLHDLFGVLDDRESLSVWLRGRRMVLIDADAAAAHHEGEKADWYRRRDLPGAKLLWELER